MLKQRVLATLKFFDLQGVPLTLLELHEFLLADLDTIKLRLNERFELVGELNGQASEGTNALAPPVAPVVLSEILKLLDELVREEAISESQGYYCLPGRGKTITERLRNYVYGIQRERRIRRFLPFLRHVPFVRGVAIGGSQAMGQQTSGSDIDLFIVTDSSYLWLARSLVTFYFQMFGVRRHGKKIANRFCLNHYVAGPRAVEDELDPYNAMEYLRLRPVVYPEGIKNFIYGNRLWIQVWYPETNNFITSSQHQSLIQKTFELLFKNAVGNRLERQLGLWQLARIKTGEYAVATDQELSFHSIDRKLQLLKDLMQ